MDEQEQYAADWGTQAQEATEDSDAVEAVPATVHVFELPPGARLAAAYHKDGSITMYVNDAARGQFCVAAADGPSPS